MIDNEPDTRIMELLRDGTYGIWDYNTSRVTATGSPGKNWIYNDMPRIDLVKESYPRVSVVHVSESGSPIGFDAITDWNDIRIAIFIQTKKDLMVPKITGYSSYTLTSDASENIGDIELLE